ncbi:MAG: hypothetical protein ACTHNT_05870 [Actinomycetales bacterium]
MSALAAAVLPQPKHLRDLFSDLLGRDVEVTLCGAFNPSPSTPCSVGVYVDDTLRMTAVVLMDFPLSAYAGASIGLIPVGGAEACIEDGELSRMVFENLAEILNVLAGTLNEQPEAPHQKLYACYDPAAALPPDVSAAAQSIVGRLDLEVAIAGYGKGRLGIVQVF